MHMLEMEIDIGGGQSLFSLQGHQNTRRGGGAKLMLDHINVAF